MPRFFCAFFLTAALNSDWGTGLERLIDDQNHATMEDLIELMMMDGDHDVYLPTWTFPILLGQQHNLFDYTRDGK